MKAIRLSVKQNFFEKCRYIKHLFILYASGASPEYEDTFHLLSLAIIMVTLNNNNAMWNGGYLDLPLI